MPDFDPQAPLIASDGLEYACFADYLVGESIDSWRNVEILSRRARGESEEVVRRWIEAYDGPNPEPGACATPARKWRARFNDKLNAFF